MGISTDNLIYPYFVVEGSGRKETIDNFPGVFRFSIDRLIKDLGHTRSLGIKKILLFGIPHKKDVAGATAFKKDTIIARAIKEIKINFKDIAVFTDVCLCAYTAHGHCGILNNQRKIDGQKTLNALSRIALIHAQAGADWVAPSAMAKHQVREIRRSLDKNGFKKTKILGYSAKFHSNFYGPFRNACDSAPRFGDRSGYQLDYANIKAALNEVEDDIREGADMVMVKPAISYLDVIRQVKSKFNHPLAAYNVSGEYAFIKYGAKKGLWDEKKMIKEVLASLKRAGADFIITYFAKDVAKWLREEKF